MPDSRLGDAARRRVSSGLNASLTAMSGERSASDFSTSSNCLPPVTDAANACVIARAKALALTVRSLVLRAQGVERTRRVQSRRMSSLMAIAASFRCPETRCISSCEIARVSIGAEARP